GRMLVGPGGASARRLDDLEDGIDAEILVRPYGLAALRRIARQLRLVDGGVELVAVDVDIGVERRGGAGLRAIRAGGGEGAIPGIVIEDAGLLRQGAGDQRDHPGKAVGRARRAGMRIERAPRAELGERRVRV